MIGSDRNAAKGATHHCPERFTLMRRARSLHVAPGETPSLSADPLTETTT